MALVSFERMLFEAKMNGYAVGYFEPWNMESILAVTDAAEEKRSPVIIGVCGDYLLGDSRIDRIPLSVAYSLCESAAKAAEVPVSVLFNETSVVSDAIEAAKAGFSGVMLHSEGMDEEAYEKSLNETVTRTSIYNILVEGEYGHLSTSEDGTLGKTSDGEIKNAETVKDFIQTTGVGALSVSIGNAHLLVNGKASLDFGLFERIAHSVDTPLVIHGGSGISGEDVKTLVSLGMVKLNVGASLKKAFAGAMKTKLDGIESYVNPNDLLGKGGDADIMTAGRIAMKDIVLDYLEWLGCAGKEF